MGIASQVRFARGIRCPEPGSSEATREPGALLGVDLCNASAARQAGFRGSFLW